METDDMELDLSKYVDVLRRWLRLLVLGPLLAGTVALAVSFLLPSVYEAEADVASVKSFSQISLSPDYKTLSEAQLTQGLDMAARQKALVAIARGNEIASTVVAELGAGLLPEERDVAKLVAMVNVSADGDLIRIKVQNKDPQKAARIANSWAAIYAGRVNQLYTESPTSLDQVQAQASAAWQNYQAAESTFNQFIGVSQIDAISREIAARQNTINDLYAVQRNLDRVLVDARSLQDLLAKNSSMSGNDAGNRLAALLIQTNVATLSYFASSTNPASSSNSAFFSNPTSSSSNPASSASNPASSSNPAFFSNPATLPVQIQIASTSLGDMTPSDIRRQTESLIAVLEAQRRQVESRLVDPTLQSQILTLQKELEQQSAKKHELTTARDLAWSAYKTMAGKIEEVRMAQQSSSTIVRVAGSATVPSQPVAPKKSMNALLAAIAGLLLSMGIAFTMEYLNPRFRSPAEAAERLKLPVFQIELEQRKMGRHSDQNPLSTGLLALSPYYRLWANVFLGSQTPSRTVLLASLDRSESLGRIAANLGIVTAHSGRRTILVDADPANPMLDGFFGVSNSQGWSNLLGDKTPDVGIYLQPTSLDHLSVMTSGPALEHFTEWMISPRLPSVLQALKERAELVIFISAPFSRATDVLFIAKSVEGVLLLMTLESTDKDAAIQFKDQLQNVNANILGAITVLDPAGRLWSSSSRGASADENVSSVSSSGSAMRALRRTIALAFRLR
jgi:capsular polysaccharide biosynthesis protein